MQSYEKALTAALIAVVSILAETSRIWLKEKRRLYIWLIQDVDFTALDANIRRRAVAKGVSKQTDILSMENVLLRYAVRIKAFLIAGNARISRASF